MSKNIDLKVSRSLELLSAIQEVTAGYAKKEELLARDFRTRRYAVDRKYEEAAEVIAAKLAEQSEEVEKQCAGLAEQVTTIYDSRRTKFQRAHVVATRNLPKRVHDARERVLGELKMKRYRLERKMASAQEATGAQGGEFAASLADQRSKMVTLERRARAMFGGYPALLKMLVGKGAAEMDVAHSAGDHNQLLDSVREEISALEVRVVAFGTQPLPRLFASIPLGAWMLIALMCAGALAYALGFNQVAFVFAATVGLGLMALAFVLYNKGFSNAEPAARDLVGALAEAKRTHAACGVAAEAWGLKEQQRMQSEFDRTTAEIAEKSGQAGGIAKDFEMAAQTKLDTQLPRGLNSIAGILASKLEHIRSEGAAHIGRFSEEAAVRDSKHRQVHEAESAKLDAEETQRWAQLEADWKREMLPAYESVVEMNEATVPLFPAWNAQLPETWAAPTEFIPMTKFAHLDLDLARNPDALPKDPRLALPGPPQISIPLSLTYPQEGSLLFETHESGDAAVIGTFDNIILRLLCTTPPGKIAFTIIDPVGLGKNFAGLMHLSDYEESIINRRIWTQRDQIDDRLTEMSEHIEKVIQMYLRNEYATITQYNLQAGSVAEKYHFLVVADFPANFSETAARKLQSIATSGARCGVFTLIHWDQRQPLPDGFVADELRQSSTRIERGKKGFIISKAQVEGGAALVFDAPPDAELAAALAHRIGKASIDSNRVQVPFSQISPPPAEMWTNDTTNELRIAIGRTGATKMQYLAIGKGTRQHALFAGKTGSGKSTLFHVIITNLALSCSPDQVEFYLIDFKKGVEFKCYASKRLPHARVVAIESDREFALSVLQRVDGELKRRGDIFRKLGCQDLAGYKRNGGTEPMPRSLLLIDEFQEFFVEDDQIAQTASLLFDRIVRQGRAFGIHVLLGSQTLGGTYSLARATLGQMVIRVALQCNEADSYLIMDENNSAPRLLTRPGEGIYNDSAGAMEGNSPFQVVWLGDDERDDLLDKIHELAVKRDDKHASPIVFEGNAPASIRENDLLRAALAGTPKTQPHIARCWLGAPNSIKGPTEAVFQRQSGNHLLIVGQRDEAVLTMLGVSMLALAAQHPAGGAKFVLFHAATPGSPDADFMDRIVEAIPHEVIVSRGQDIGGIMSDLAADMKSRAADDNAGAAAPAVFFIIHGLHKYKKLRSEDDFSFSSSDSGGEGNPGTQFTDLISEGSAQGIHIITTVDTYNNVNRCINRKALSEFEMRIVFQMSANDSASLIDSPKASNLGLHRALFYNEHEGSLETFRPYATPDAEWVRGAAEKLGSAEL